MTEIKPKAGTLTADNKPLGSTFMTEIKPQRLLLRYAEPSDSAALAEAEAQCFPQSEAADEDSFRARLAIYPNHFWLLCGESDGIVAAFVDGFVTNESTIRDEMFSDATLHDENGCWQAIFGVATRSEYRRQGCAAALMYRAIADAKEQGRRGCILTCKEKLLHYYAKFGYVNEGVSRSVHGGAVWYDMRLTF
ncbi:MAG: GNAT family N-acetyltransferase [Eubacteriales bacterium]